MAPSFGILFVLVSFGTISYISAQDCLIEANGYCFYFRNVSEKYDRAETGCAQTGGVVFYSADDTMEDLLRITRTPKVWLAGQLEDQEPYLWRYIADCTDCSSGNIDPVKIARHQGCYADDEDSRDLSREVTVQGDMTPEKCIAACKAKSSTYTYAGVQGREGRSFKCFCDDDFGKYGKTGECNEQCPGTHANRLRCGGRERNAVYRIDGTFVHWGYNRPDNFGGHQTCATIDLHRLEGKLNDQDCWKKFNFICEMPLDKCSDNQFHTIENGAKCIFVSNVPLSDGVNWFEARQRCRAIGGDLLTLISEDARTEVITYTNKTLQEYWIGLTSRLWYWPETGEDITYTNWADGQPEKSEHNCISVHSSDYKWYSVSCDDRLPYFCVKATTTTTTTSSTTTATTPTTTTTTPTTTTTTPTTTPTTTEPTTTSQTTTRPTTSQTTTTTMQTTTTTTPETTTSEAETSGPTTTTTTTTTADPTTTQPTTTVTGPTTTTTAGRTSNAPTTTTTTPTTTTTTQPDATSGDNVAPVTAGELVGGDDGLSDVEIVLIVLCGLLLLIILIVIIVFCCCKRAKNGRSKVGVGYNARPDANVPYSGYIGEEWGYYNSGSQADLINGRSNPRPKGHFYDYETNISVNEKY